MKTLDKNNINDERYWNNFYGNIETEEVREVRLFFYRSITKYLVKKGHKTLLEIGCGTGHGLNYLSTVNRHYKYIGFDLSKEAIDVGKKKYPHLKLAQGDILEHDLRGQYDDILIVQTLEHFCNPLKLVDKLLNHCHRLIISVPYKSCLSKEKSHVSTDFSENSFKKYNIVCSDIVKRTKRKKYLCILLAGSIK